MFHVVPSKTGKSFYVVDESDEPAVFRMDGKPRSFTSQHAAQTRADDMNAEQMTEVANSVCAEALADMRAEDVLIAEEGLTTYGELEEAKTRRSEEVGGWATDELAHILAEQDSRCQAQPIHRMREVPAVGTIVRYGQVVAACAQCIEAANPKTNKLH